MGSPPCTSGSLFHPCDRSPVVELDSDRKIIAIDVEGEVNILGVQVRTGRIMETPDFATGQDQATNGLCVTRSAFEPIPKIDCAEFVFVGSLDAIVAHRDERDLIR